MEENTTKRLNYTVLTEKYRFEHVNDIVMTDEKKKYFLKIVEEKDIPNMIFYSTNPGVGKTTLAKALANDCDYEYLYINNSLTRGIDILRTTITKFASSLSFDGKKKLVILDEFDGSTPDLQKALRGFVEEFFKSCRFICTCNYISQISAPLKSRLTPINFDYSDPEVRSVMIKKIANFLVKIIKLEDYKFDKPETILKIAKEYFPDIRKMLLLLKQCDTEYGIINENIFNIKYLSEEFFDYIINKKFTAARKYIIEHNVNFDEIYSEIKTNLLDTGKIADKGARANLYGILNTHDYQNAFVVDKELNFAACLMDIFKEI